MPKTLPIFYSAMLLTGVNLLLRLVGTSFQVYLSGRIGAAGIGLLQLILTLNGLAVVYLRLNVFHALATLNCDDNTATAFDVCRINLIIQ